MDFEYNLKQIRQPNTVYYCNVKFWVNNFQASDRTLPPARWSPTPRENLLESIRDYRKNKKLKQISPRVQTKCEYAFLLDT